jgi:hypothetical protein
MNNTQEIQMSSNVHIGEEQIIQIVVSEIEERLITKKNELTTEITDLCEQDKQLNKNILKACDVFVEKMYSKDVAMLSKALKTFTGKDYKVTYEAILVKNDQDVEVLQTKATLIDDRHNNSIRKSAEVAIPAAIKKDMVLQLGIKVEVEYLSKELLEVKKNLNDIGRYERRAKAQLATATISKTANGPALLKELKANVINNDAYLRALPASCT